MYIVFVSFSFFFLFSLTLSVFFLCSLFLLFFSDPSFVPSFSLLLPLLSLSLLYLSFRTFPSYPFTFFYLSHLISTFLSTRKYFPSICSNLLFRLVRNVQMYSLSFCVLFVFSFPPRLLLKCYD